MLHICRCDHNKYALNHVLTLGGLSQKRLRESQASNAENGDEDMNSDNDELLWNSDNDIDNDVRLINGV